MSSDEYSTYEAKARFSELLRKVRAGHTVTITYHGQAIAEIHPIRPEAESKHGSRRCVRVAASRVAGA